MNLISQSASMQGFIVFNYESRYNEARVELAKWLAEGKLKRKFHIEDGLEHAPKHLQSLFDGKNTGKMCVETFLDPQPRSCQSILTLSVRLRALLASIHILIAFSPLERQRLRPSNHFAPFRRVDGPPLISQSLKMEPHDHPRLGIPSSPKPS